MRLIVTDVAAVGTQWAFLLGMTLGGMIGAQWGRWSVLLQRRWAPVAWHERQRRKRMRPGRRDRRSW